MISQRLRVVVVLFLIGAMPIVCFARQDTADWEASELSPASLAALKTARSYTRMATFDLAIRLYEELIGQYPRNPFLLKEAADAYAGKKAFGKAKTLYDQALFLKPTDTAIRLAWPRGLYDNGRRTKAIRVLQVMLKKNPDFLEAHRQVLPYLVHAGKWNAAVVQYDFLLYVQPLDRKLLAGRIQALKWAQRWPEVIAQCEELLKKDPSDKNILLEKIQALKMAQRWKQTAREYGKLLEKAPKERDLRFKKIEALKFAKNWKAAAREVDKLLVEQPQDDAMRREKIRLLTWAQAWSEALEEFDTLLEKNPKDIALRLQKIHVLGFARRWKDAAAEYDVLLESNPHDVLFHIEKAKLLTLANDWTAAIKQYDKALGLAPDNIGAQAQKAKLLSWSGRWDEAIEVYEKLIRDTPDDLEAVKDLAILYTWKNRWDKAQELLHVVLARKPKDPAILEALGNAYLFDQRYASAREMYLQVTQANPEAARRLSSRLDDVVHMAAPMLSYSFFYYSERDRSITPRTLAQSFYHTTEWQMPLAETVNWFFSTTFRHDDAIKGTANAYGTSLQARLRRNLWHRVSLSWEVRNFGFNPRWGLRNTTTWIPYERWTLDAFHQYQTYWDTDKANSVGFGIGRSFFEKRDVLLSYRLNYDVIDDINPYFVRIKNRENEILDLITNTVSLEKYWQVFSQSVLTTRINLDVTTQGRSALTLYGGLSVPLTKTTQMVMGVSLSDDTKDVEAISASAYLSHRF